MERGRYLVRHVTHCFLCHSEIDWGAEGCPPKAGREGAGVSPFHEDALPWLSAPNITPDPETGLGRWTDEEIVRALRQGVGRDGRTLFPLMPYPLYRELSDADVGAIVAYLRTVPPVRNAVPPSRIPPEVKESLAALPPAGPVGAPDRSDPVAHGRYLAQAAGCVMCHTPQDAKGRPVAGMEWAGGFRLKGSWGDIAAPNLTPDPSGLAHYDEALFLKVMRTGNPGGRPLRGIMPWGYYRGMTDEDLRAIFAFLRTLRPIRHRVDNVAAPTPCSACGGAHGLGDQNR